MKDEEKKVAVQLPTEVSQKEIEKAKEEIMQDIPLTYKDKFRCKKCSGLKPIKDARVMIVLQRNKPLEMPHIMFQTKAEVTICKQCYEQMKRD